MPVATWSGGLCHGGILPQPERAEPRELSRLSAGGDRRAKPRRQSAEWRERLLKTVLLWRLNQVTRASGKSRFIRSNS